MPSCKLRIAIVVNELIIGICRLKATPHNLIFTVTREHLIPNTAKPKTPNIAWFCRLQKGNGNIYCQTYFLGRDIGVWRISPTVFIILAEKLRSFTWTHHSPPTQCPT